MVQILYFLAENSKLVFLGALHDTKGFFKDYFFGDDDHELVQLHHIGIENEFIGGIHNIGHLIFG